MSFSFTDRLVTWLLEEAEAGRLTASQWQRLRDFFGAEGVPQKIDAAWVRQTCTTAKVPIYSGPLPEPKKTSNA
jgi:hypothetical protein